MGAPIGVAFYSNARLRQGFRHYQTGQDFPREYDGWPEGDQHDYEMGRQIAAAASALDIHEHHVGATVPPKVEREFSAGRLKTGWENGATPAVAPAQPQEPML